MTSFQPSYRRFDPYGETLINKTTNNSSTRHHASTIKQQRTLLDGNAVSRRTNSSEIPSSSSPAAFHTTAQHHAIPVRGHDAFQHQPDYLLAKTNVTHRNRHVGVATLSSQMHPLMATRRPSRSVHDQDGPNYYKDKPSSHHRHAAVFSPAQNLFLQARRILSLLLGQLTQEDLLMLQKPQKFRNDEELMRQLLSAKSTARTLRLFLLLPLLILAVKQFLPPVIDRLTRPKPWAWSSGVPLPGQPALPRRNLAGRNCVMNYFIEKQPPDEYDPDFAVRKLDPMTGKLALPPPVTIVQGTYRTKGQIHVISRFIEAVASSFRSNTKVRQHLIFAETRDSGHLAQEAMRHWPPRGKHKTMVHVIASNDLPLDMTSMNAAKALGYGSLDEIELRFQGVDKVRIYDRDGNVAGLVNDQVADDDETLNGIEADLPDKETLEFRLRTRKVGGTINSTVLSDGTHYPNFRAMLPFEEEEDGEGEVIVPYLHVDGVSMLHQLQVLESAKSLFIDRTIVVVGMEHSPDMDVRKLIAFFQEVNYKTFFLGARQLARIDNLCDEILNDVLNHPSVSTPTVSRLRYFFIRLGLLSKDELRIVGDSKTPQGPKQRETPPFFVAMPRGRKNKEETTIQHMYDLFGGYGGGGGQIKTANDRKAPGK